MQKNSMPRRLFPWSSRRSEKQQPKNNVFMLHEGSAGDVNMLGLKGTHLSEIYRMDLTVPPGFIITSEAAREFSNLQHAKQSEIISEEYRKSVEELERQSGKKFGVVHEEKVTTGVSATVSTSGMSVSKEQQYRGTIPLLLSVRASPAISMPGVMDAILNIGMNDDICDRMAKASDNPRWAYDTYRRFLQLYGTNVHGIDDKRYKLIMASARLQAGVTHDSDLSVTDLQHVISEFKRLANIPQDPWEQLQTCINSIYKSWYSYKADKYREIYGVTEDLGIAIIVQSMVFGNLNGRCGVGTAYSRNPTTGDKEYVGEFASCTSGDDVFASCSEIKTLDDLRREQSGLFHNITNILHSLEKHFRDVQEIEFTVEDGKLYLLHVAPSSRSSHAAITFAVDMVKERLISEREALMRFDPVQMMHCIRPVVAPEFKDPHNKEAMKRIIGKGLPTAPGTAIGKVVFSTQEAVACRNKNENCILCLHELTTDDIEGLEAASGIISMRGGMSSHASTWMRGAGKPSVTSLKNVGIDPKAKQLLCVDSGGKVSEGDTITIDGTAGLVYFGEAPTVPARQEDAYYQLLNWARKYKVLNILSSADNVNDINDGFSRGADGIGIFRTEQMFLSPGRLELTRFILLTNNESDRAAALTRLLELQRDDLLEVFRAVGDRDIVVRLLDLSLNAALPTPQDADFQQVMDQLSESLGVSKEDIDQRINELSEPNPLLGVRGCRLAFIQPFFVSMQAKAIAKAVMIARREGVKVNAKALLPIAFSDREVDRILPLVSEAMAETCAQDIVLSDFKDFKLDMEIGVDVANPRACFKCDKFGLNKNVGFLSFDTDSLTELTFGITKEQSTRFMPLYVDKHIISRDPFTCIDTSAVGRLIEFAIENARKQSSDVKVNVCGMHTADPLSVRFFNNAGVDTLTVGNNDWIPVATLSAAQAAINPEQMHVTHFSNPLKI